MLPRHDRISARSLLPLLACAACLSGAVLADPVPGSLRSCATIPDAAARLACYDREAGRSGPGSPPGGGQTGAPRSASTPASPSQGAAPPASGNPRPVSEPPGTSLLARVKPATFRARVLRIEHAEGGMRLALDNGQVWAEVQPTAGDLSLRPGDPVQIRRALGSYYLTGPHVRDMSVRQR